MKLPIPFLLYVISLGLFALAGWTVYQMLPMWKSEVRDKATRTGQEEGKDLLGKGRGQGPASGGVWVYGTGSAPWWAGFKEANLIGKLPPPPPVPVTGTAVQEAVQVDVRPLSEFIELVSLVHDGQTDGKGGSSHVVVRFKPEANVEPAEYWLRENMAPPPGAVPSAPGGRDGVALRTGSGRPPQVPASPTAPRAVQGGRAATPLPTASLTGREVVQKVWVEDGGDVRRSAVVWPIRPSQPSEPGKSSEVGRIRLVRVAEDAQSAFFVREQPPPKAGEPAPEPKEEELIKTTFDLSQDLLRELRLLQGRADVVNRTSNPSMPTATTWTNVEETTLRGNVRHLGTKDQERFQQDPDAFLEQLNVDTYVSRKSNTKGLIVRNVDPKLSSAFGVSAGEVLIEINSRKVESKAQAVSLVKADYNRGVRTFTTKWWANGQVVDRTYQAPDK